MEALLIVDMQNSCFEEATRYRADSVFSNINYLSGIFRLEGRPVIHIQHEDDTDEFRKSSHGWNIIPEINLEITDFFVSKTCCDAFIGTKLSETLEHLNVNKLYIVGCATDFCVDSTIKGAIANGYNVVIPSDGHTASDRPHIDAKALIDHFNWNWANLITGDLEVVVTDTLAAAKLNKPL